MVICLTGFAHSGKDTTANHMVEACQQKGLKAIRLGLADRLKVICQKLIELFYGLCIPLEDFYDPIKKEIEHPEYPMFAGKPFKLRTILQIVGSEVFREYLWGDIWCDYIYRTYICNPSHDVIIMSDCRFPNELDYYVRLVHKGEISKCLSYRIVRPQREALATENQSHQSERHIMTLPVDTEILNNGTIEDLYAKANAIVDDVYSYYLRP